LKLDGYLLALVAAILWGLSWPAPVVSGGPLHLDVVTQVGMALIFFFHGGALALATLRAEAGRWQLHALIQGTTYIVFPLLALLVYLAGQPFLPPETRLGFFFVGAVSTTISSSIAMTSVGRGNVPIALFNATLSGLLGLFLTPLLMGAISASGGIHLPLGDAIQRICILLLLPLVAGQVLRPWLGARLSAYKRQTGLFERGVIVLIVLNAFANATAGGIWRQYDAVTLLAIAVVVTVLLVAVLYFCKAVSGILGLPRGDEVAYVFCGSTKSLANGAPIAQILFGASAATGAILLPLVLYHQFQLIALSLMARAYARRFPT
jgi:sodium/bile acid cotransporter 7